MALDPSPPRDSPPGSEDLEDDESQSEEDSEFPSQISIETDPDERNASREQWLQVLQHELREVTLCDYHDFALWLRMGSAVLWGPEEIRIADEFALKMDPRLNQCRLCGLFSGPPFEDGSFVMEFWLNSRKPYWYKREWYPLVTTTPRGLTPDESQVMTFCVKIPGGDQSIGQKPRIVSPEHINYDLLAGWLDKCRLSHDFEDCLPESEPIPGLKLIDCSARNVVSLSEPGCRYVALSYVWGDASAEARDDRSPYSRTIEDAITVTVALGMQYLWVDQHVRPSSR